MKRFYKYIRFKLSFGGRSENYWPPNKLWTKWQILTKLGTHIIPLQPTTPIFAPVNFLPSVVPTWQQWERH